MSPAPCAAEGTTLEPNNTVKDETAISKSRSKHYGLGFRV